MRVIFALIGAFLIFYAPGTSSALAAGADSVLTIHADSAVWVNAATNRQIPVLTFTLHVGGIKKQVPVIINTGYLAKRYEYNTIAEGLAAAGYYVVVVQHNLPGDAPMPTGGQVYTDRLPYWQKGVANIKYVVAEMKASLPLLDYKKLVLIGDADAGDMLMLLAGDDKHLAYKVIGLDNQHVPVPLTKKPRIFSIRSKDERADVAVLPTAKEEAKYKITIIPSNVLHKNMSGYRAPAAAAEILSDILRCLAVVK